MGAWGIPSRLGCLVVLGLTVVVGCGNPNHGSIQVVGAAHFMVTNDTGRAADVVDCSGAVVATCEVRASLHLLPGESGQLPFSSSTRSADIAKVEGVWEPTRCIFIPMPPPGGRSETLRRGLSSATPVECGQFGQGGHGVFPTLPGLTPALHGRDGQ